MSCICVFSFTCKVESGHLIHFIEWLHPSPSGICKGLCCLCCCFTEGRGYCRHPGGGEGWQFNCNKSVSVIFAMVMLLVCRSCQKYCLYLRDSMNGLKSTATQGRWSGCFCVVALFCTWYQLLPFWWSFLCGRPCLSALLTCRPDPSPRRKVQTTTDASSDDCWCLTYMRATSKQRYFNMITWIQLGSIDAMTLCVVTQIGFTALHCAAENGREEVAELLVEQSAVLDLVTKVWHLRHRMPCRTFGSAANRSCLLILITKISRTTLERLYDLLVDFLFALYLC